MLNDEQQQFGGSNLDGRLTSTIINAGPPRKIESPPDPDLPSIGQGAYKLLSTLIA